MQTKFKIVETEDYILAVSDEERGVEGYNYNFGLSKINKLTKTYPTHSTEWNFCKKIIAYQPKGNAAELNLPLLPEIVVEDNVEKLAEREYPLTGVIGIDARNGLRIEGLKLGYKAATKIFSEEDVYDILDLGANNKGLRKGEILDLFNKSKQSKTPKFFVAEMQTTKSEVFRENDNVPYVTLKTTTINGKTYLVGKFENE
jgi:hypothetical protein